MSSELNTVFAKNDTLKVKGIAVCMLLFHHLFRTVERIEAYGLRIPGFLSPELIAFVATASRVCVWIFAFLSAYGLALKYEKVKNKTTYFRFVYHQWWSLMMPFWFIYIVVFVLSFLLFRNPMEVYAGSWLNLPLDFLGLADLFETPMLSSVWWYMCFAQVLVLVLPLLVELVDRTGVCSIAIVYLFLSFFGSGFTSTYGGAYANYIYAILLAILCVKYRLFERFGQIRGKGAALAEGITLLAVFAGGACLKVRMSGTVIERVGTMVSAVSVMALCLFAQKYIRIPWIEKVLAFLGKHSGNIFMIHGLIFVYHPEIVYWSGRVSVSFITLLVISLTASILIEQMKKWLRYDRLMSTVSKSILEKLSGEKHPSEAAERI